MKFVFLRYLKLERKCVQLQRAKQSERIRRRLGAEGEPTKKEVKPNREFDIKYFDINPDADPESKADLETILREYCDVFAFDNTDLSCTDEVEHTIDTGDTPPIRQRYHNRFGKEECKFIDQQVEEMLRCGVITRGYSPWCSNVVLAPKKGGKIRFYTDFRLLNKHTVFRSFCVLRIQDVRKRSALP